MINPSNRRHWPNDCLCWSIVQDAGLMDIQAIDLLCKVKRQKLVSSCCLCTGRYTLPSKHETLNQCWFDVAPPPSTTLAQHQINIRSTSWVWCLVLIVHLGIFVCRRLVMVPLPMQVCLMNWFRSPYFMYSTITHRGSSCVHTPSTRTMLGSLSRAIIFTSLWKSTLE